MSVCFENPLTDEDKRMIKNYINRSVDSLEELDKLRCDSTFRARMLLPFVVFGSSEEIQFPDNESAYKKKPLHVNLPADKAGDYSVDDDLKFDIS